MRPQGAAEATSAMAIATPCCTRRLAIVVTSARSGRLARTSGAALRRLAAISGNAAFLAPPILIVPDNGTPPRIRILSIISAPAVRPAASGARTRPTLRHVTCFYARRRRRSSRRLIARRLVVERVRRIALAGAGLLLAAAQILAQRPRAARLARRLLSAPGRREMGDIGHRRNGTGAARRLSTPWATPWATPSAITPRRAR